jgi:hypothetical protein
MTVRIARVQKCRFSHASWQRAAFDVSLGGVCGPQYAQATKHEDAHSLETFLGLLLHKYALALHALFQD